MRKKHLSLPWYCRKKCIKLRISNHFSLELQLYVVCCLCWACSQIICSDFITVVDGLFHLTNRFHVAMRLFSKRSQMMSKCGKKKKWHTMCSRVYHWCSYHILTSSVIYYWTDARQHGIYYFVKWNINIRNLFVKWNINVRKKAFLFQISPLWQTGK